MAALRISSAAKPLRTNMIEPAVSAAAIDCPKVPYYRVNWIRFGEGLGGGSIGCCLLRRRQRREARAGLESLNSAGVCDRGYAASARGSEEILPSCAPATSTMR